MGDTLPSHAGFLFIFPAARGSGLLYECLNLLNMRVQHLHSSEHLTGRTFLRADHSMRITVCGSQYADHSMRAFLDNHSRYVPYFTRIGDGSITDITHISNEMSRQPKRGSTNQCPGQPHTLARIDASTVFLRAVISNDECPMSNVQCPMSSVEWRLSVVDCRILNAESACKVPVSIASI